MKVKELTDWLDGRYPADMAEHWDNVGLLVGDDEAEVHHVLLALDLTEKTLDEAISAGADMIITHHPMIFEGQKNRAQNSETDQKQDSVLCDAYQLRRAWYGRTQCRLSETYR